MYQHVATEYIYLFIDTAQVLCSRVYVTIRPSVYPFVCPSYLAPQPRRAAGLLLWAWRTGDIHRQRLAPSSSRAATRAAALRSAANASSVTFTADVGG